MARKVFITSDMSIDEQLAEVAEQDSLAALIWPWFLTTFDDWGRAEAHPRRLKAKVFPMNDMVTVEVIERTLRLYEKVGLLVLYEVDGKPYMAIPEDKWYKYQTHMNRSRRPGKDKMDSDLPAPPSGNRGESHDPHGEIENPHGAPRGSVGTSGGSENPNGAPQFPLPSPSPSPSRDQDHRRRCHHAHAREEVAVTVEPQEDERPDARPMESPPELDAKLGEVARTYEQEIGVLSAMVQQELVTLVDEYPADWIRDAIRQAALQNVRKLSYVRSILANWRTEGRSARGHPSVRQDAQVTETRKRRKRGAEHGASGGSVGEDAYWDELERAYFGS